MLRTPQHSSACSLRLHPAAGGAARTGRRRCARSRKWSAASAPCVRVAWRASFSAHHRVDTGSCSSQDQALGRHVLRARQGQNQLKTAIRRLKSRNFFGAARPIRAVNRGDLLSDFRSRLIDMGTNRCDQKRSGQGHISAQAGANDHIGSS